ncbi:hypothetical protein [Limosilactobacillus fermentum]
MIEINSNRFDPVGQAGVGDGGHEPGVGRPVHRGLDERVLGVQKFGNG